MFKVQDVMLGSVNLCCLIFVRDKRALIAAWDVLFSGLSNIFHNKE